MSLSTTTNAAPTPTIGEPGAAAEIMTPTGERMVPEICSAETFWEHIYRYKFAKAYVAGKIVLDIACGEGYGSAALMRAGARQVIGMDVSEEACQHARARYGVDARVGDAQNIPLPDGSIDVVVSFETIEHVPSPVGFVDECVRILAPGGTLVISTPNKGVYNQGEADNPFHCSEMEAAEFEAMIAARFSSHEMMVQKFPVPTAGVPYHLLTEESKFSKVRGSHRLRKMLLKRFYPYLYGETVDLVRAQTVDAILSEDAPPALENFFVQKPDAKNATQPEYLIAVARKRT